MSSYFMFIIILKFQLGAILIILISEVIARIIKYIILIRENNNEV